MEQLSLNIKQMFETLSSYEQLKESWKLVKANGGAAGVDGQTLESFGSKLEEELKHLSTEVRNWDYRPQPVRRVEIPKPGNREKRKLGIPTVRDRVLQQSIRQSLEPLYEPEFSEFSFGFRPGKGQQDAIEAAHCMVASGKDWVVDIDLEKFFDRINQDRLIHTLSLKVRDKRVLRLIGLVLRSGINHRGSYEPNTQGAPQGSPLSPLLSNIVLDELDKELEKRGLFFCRYADDAKIYVGSQKAGARVMQSVKRFIEKRLKLKVNQEKSQVARSWNVVFLGFVITKRVVRISKKSLKRAINKTRELVNRSSHLPLEEQLRRVNSWYAGWANYYKLSFFPSQLSYVEGHIRRRFRAQFIANAKRKRTLVSKLISQGAEANLVMRTVYGRNRRRWNLSQTKAAHQAWGNDWFLFQGLKTFSHLELPHWRPKRVPGLMVM